jgi:RHS repeat-associated protein
MTYDTLGRKKTMTHPDLGYWTYTYDKNNNLLTQTDAKGQIITFGYDALNRMVSKSYSTGQPTVYNIYDNLDLANGIGKLYATIQDTTPSGMKGFKTEYTYDVAGKTTSVLYPDSSRFYYQYYPSSGLLMNVLGSDQQTVYAHLCTYEPTGKIGQVTYGNLTATQYSYDSLSTRLTDIITHDPQFPNDPNKDFVHRHYTYSKAGDILGILDTAKGITTNYTYTYDNLHRLLTENSGGVYAAVAYAYSAIGNITSRQVGSNSMAYVYDTTKKHAVKTITYNSNTYTYYYDNNGNMTQGTDFTNLGQITQRTITYDTDNMPTQITEGSTTTNFTYDGDGDRVKKVTPGGATVYYVGDHYEVKDNENIKYLFAGNLRLIMIKGTNTFYYHKDHLNSTSVMTNNNAVVVETTQYEPFGATRAHTGTDMSGYKFTDQELDNESNLYNYDARLYDPVIGRFITGDSVMQDAHDPQKLNPYAYCRNNPLIYTDPTGRIIFAIEYNSNKQYGSYIITIKNWKIKIFDARTRADDNRPPVSNGIYSAHFGQHFGTRGNTPYDALRMVRYNTATSESTETDENRTLPAGLFGLDKRKYINIHRGDRMQPDKNGEVQETSSESCFVIPWSNNLKDKWQPNNPKSWGQYTEFISQYDKNDTNETVVVSRDIDRVRKVITFVPNAIINGIKKVIKNSSED